MFIKRPVAIFTNIEVPWLKPSRWNHHTYPQILPVIAEQCQPVPTICCTLHIAAVCANVFQTLRK